MKVYVPIKLGKTRENLPIGVYSDFEKAKSIVVESIVAEVQTWDVLASSIVAVDRDTSNQEHVVLLKAFLHWHVYSYPLYVLKKE